MNILRPLMYFFCHTLASSGRDNSKYGLCETKSIKTVLLKIITGREIMSLILEKYSNKLLQF